jgi:auxin efflux carrier family protein
MGMNGSELVVPLVGAFQASISVLLTIVFGVLAAQFNLLSTKAAKELSTLCVRMFMPALLIYQVGKELEVGTLPRYIPIISV